jgi:hypothetical protein
MRSSECGLLAKRRARTPDTGWRTGAFELVVSKEDQAREFVRELSRAARTEVDLPCQEGVAVGRPPKEPPNR